MAHSPLRLIEPKLKLPPAITQPTDEGVNSNTSFVVFPRLNRKRRAALTQLSVPNELVTADVNRRAHPLAVSPV